MREIIHTALRRIGATAMAVVRAIGAVFGVRDVLCFGGLACVWHGLAMVHEPSAWVVVGAALFWLAAGRQPAGRAE